MWMGGILAYLKKMDKEYGEATESFQKRAESALRFTKLQGQIRFDFIVMNQIFKVLTSLTEEEYMVEVGKLYSLTPSSWRNTDSQFIQDIEEIDEAYANCLERCYEANNGSEYEKDEVLYEPPDGLYYQDVFHALINLYDRKGLLIEKRKVQVI